MDFSPNEQHDSIRAAIRELCKDFADPYWRELDRHNGYEYEGWDLEEALDPCTP